MDQKSEIGKQSKYIYKNCFVGQKWPIFIEDLRDDEEIPFLHYPEEYVGQKSVKLVCAQHWNAYYRPDVTPYKQKKITQSWIDFFQEDQYPFERVQLCSRTSQAVFDALCMQENIEFLRLKWSAFSDLSAIRNLKKLKRLYIGIGSSITDISPLADLTQLEALSLECTTKLTDYSPLKSLVNLAFLEISGTLVSPVRIDMQSDEFLFGLKNLKVLHIPCVRVAERSFLFEENFEKLQYVSCRRS